MNSLATYQDASTAWLSSDTMLSWVTSSVYERFAGGGYMSGVKLTRGFSEPAKAKDKEAKGKEKQKDEDESSTNGDIPGLDVRQQKILNRRSAPPATRISKEEQSETNKVPKKETEGPHSRLQRQLSSLMEVDGRGADTEEQIQQRQEQEMQDYHAQAGETQEREVDHLILVTHGIGQQLSLRYVPSPRRIQTAHNVFQHGKRELRARRQCATEDFEIRLRQLRRFEGSQLRARGRQRELSCSGPPCVLATSA